MKLKKLLQGSVFAAALAVCLSAGIVTAKAADGAFDDAGVSSVSIDTTKQELKATASTGELLVGIGTKKTTKNGSTITVPTWDVYDNTSAVTVDLSKLSNAKDNYIVLSSNKENAQVSVIKIPAAAKAISATFDAVNGSLKVGTGINAKAAKEAADEIKADGYEYRTSYGSWKNLYDTKAVDLTTYQNQGAVLYVRAKGSAPSSLSVPSTDPETLMYGDQTVKVYEGVAMPGKEAKVNIAAKAKGPAVAVDYTKGTVVSLPKKSEYRAVNKGGIKWDKANSGKPISVGENVVKNISVADIYANVDLATNTDPLTLEVRTAATATKPASKWTRISLEKPAAISELVKTIGDIDTDGKTPEGSETKVYGDKGVKLSVIVEDKNASTSNISVTTYDGKKKLVVLENSSETTAYEVVVKTENTAPTTETVKKLAVKTTKNGKLSLSKVEDGSYIYVRKAGNKAGKQWVSAWAYLGRVDYPDKAAKLEGTKGEQVK